MVKSVIWKCEDENVSINVEVVNVHVSQTATSGRQAHQNE